jgi:hypothetical protein
MHKHTVWTVSCQFDQNSDMAARFVAGKWPALPAADAGAKTGETGKNP